MERNIDEVIETGKAFFKVYDIVGEERNLIIRLFKRFFYRTIEDKYGYLKPNTNDKVEISGRLLCLELEVNPKILKHLDMITTFG